MNVLTIPGLWNSGPEHWQTHWEAKHAGVRRVIQRDLLSGAARCLQCWPRIRWDARSWRNGRWLTGERAWQEHFSWLPAMSMRRAIPSKDEASTGCRCRLSRSRVWSSRARMINTCPSIERAHSRQPGEAASSKSATPATSTPPPASAHGPRGNGCCASLVS